MKLNESKSLDLLFARLNWPSSLTRGKAAQALAKLLANAETRQETTSALVRKMSLEKLEARAADLLLPLLMARAVGGEIIPPAPLCNQIQYPSILSQLILEELGLCQDRVAWKTFHSNTAPADFLIDRYFERNTQACLPPLYRNMAERIESDYRLQFFKQWAFESKILIERTGLAPTPPAYFPGQSRDEHYFSLEYPQSDLYRSSFMRALSWALASEQVEQGAVWTWALATCPVDVGLSRVSVKAKPDWWPSPENMPAERGEAARLIWSMVARLWEEWMQGEDREWLLAVAKGPIWRAENRLHRLDIVAGYQSPYSLELAPIDEIFEWLDTVRSGAPGNFGVTLGGRFVQDRLRARRFGGWDVSPVAGRFESWAGPRWQFWRIGGLWGPVLNESAQEVTLKPSEDALTFNSGGIAIARWQDWAYDFNEVLEANLPANAGQVLLMRRNLASKVTAESNASLCWFCRLTTFERKSSWGQYERFVDFRMFGETRRIVVNPKNC